MEELNVYEEELPCGMGELPPYLKNILLSELEEEEKYSAIERFTLMKQRMFHKIEWPQEALCESHCDKSRSP